MCVQPTGPALPNLSEGDQPPDTEGVLKPVRRGASRDGPGATLRTPNDGHSIGFNGNHG